MVANLILTFDENPQQIVDIPLTETVLNDKKMFFMYVTKGLNKEEKETLVKISCCIYYRSDSLKSKRHWYNKQNGKFYDDEIPSLMKELYGIECTYEPINK